MLLKEIKTAIGDKELSIAVPGKVGDMIAFTAEQVPKINDAVDFVNVSLSNKRRYRNGMLIILGHVLRLDEPTRQRHQPSHWH